MLEAERKDFFTCSGSINFSSSRYCLTALLPAPKKQIKRSRFFGPSFAPSISKSDPLHLTSSGYNRYTAGDPQHMGRYLVDYGLSIYYIALNPLFHQWRPEPERPFTVSRGKKQRKRILMLTCFRGLLLLPLSPDKPTKKDGPASNL